MRPSWRVLAGLLAAGCLAGPAAAHPHVFVDGAVDLVVGPDDRLGAVEVTWLYDAFETLYLLSTFDVAMDASGTVSEADRAAVERALSEWPADFDGSVHIAAGGEALALGWPEAPAVAVIDGRLQLRFRRDLAEPLDLAGARLEVAMYERTYFFAFSLSRGPEFFGAPPGRCAAIVVPFEPDDRTAELRRALSALDRDDVPKMPEVGRHFADRIELACD
jgi:ABC-type uncharacterized transport system substrate-binding protein